MRGELRAVPVAPSAGNPGPALFCQEEPMKTYDSTLEIDGSAEHHRLNASLKQRSEELATRAG